MRQTTRQKYKKMNINVLSYHFCVISEPYARDNNSHYKRTGFKVYAYFRKVALIVRKFQNR